MTLPDKRERDAPYTQAELEQVRRIRQRRRRVLILFLTYLPAAALGSLVHERVGIVTAVVWMVAIGITGSILGWSSCPRCHQACFTRPVLG